MPCWALMFVTWLVHVVRFRRGVAEPFLDNSGFFLDTNHFWALSTCIHAFTARHSSAGFMRQWRRSLWWSAAVHLIDLAATVAAGQCHTCDFVGQHVVQLHLETKSQVWHGVPRNFFLTVAQLLYRVKLCSVQCNFVARMLRALIGQFLFLWQSCSVWHAQLHTATLSRDIVARQSCATKLQVRHRPNAAHGTNIYLISETLVNLREPITEAVWPCFRSSLVD